MFFSDVAEKSVEKIQARWISKRHSYVFYTSPAWVEVGFFFASSAENLSSFITVWLTANVDRLQITLPGLHRITVS